MSNLHLNVLPISVPDVHITVGVLPFTDKDALRDLRSEHSKTHVLKRGRLHDADVIFAVALDGTPCAFAHRHEEITVRSNLGLVCALVENYFLRTFHGHRKILGFHPLEILDQGDKGDYLREAAMGLEVPPWIVVRNCRSIETRIFAFEKREPTVGIIVRQRSHRSIDRTCADLISDGVDVCGLYVVEKQAREDSRYEPQLRLVGRVSRVEGNLLHLDDYRDGISTICADAVQPEASFAGIYRCLSSLFGAKKAAEIDLRLFDIQSRARGGKAAFDELVLIASRLRSKKGLQIAPGLQIQFGEPLNQSNPAFPEVKFCPPALFVFDPAGSKPATPHRHELFARGPYSQRGFSPSKPRICVVCERNRQGEVEQFLYKFFHGVNEPGRKNYFPEGFVKSYRLVDVELRTFVAENSSAGAYHKAAQAALADVETDDQRWHMALVQVDESSHDLRGSDNPYLVTKAAFLAQQIPTQEFETETMASRGSSIDFVLSNMALASYAKLGGTPWHLQVDHPLAHELVIGLGSAYVADSRLGSRQRVVGITTLFTGEGRYMLGNVSRVVPFEEYRSAVIEMLRGALERARADMNWQKGDEVRLIFHSFKPMKDDEAEAVKAIATDLAKDFHLDFAFLHVAQDQPLALFDSEQGGVKAFGGGNKGAYAPARGGYIHLGRGATLLSLVGPGELKKAADGLPSPILLRLHRSSSFYDMEYLTKQVFNFSAHSWRSFNPAGMPVSILYSQLIARLLGQLGALPGFSADSLIGRLNRLRWFL